VRKSGVWMTQLDDRILEHLAGESWASPRTMATAFVGTSSEARIWERCRVLSAAGLIGPMWPGTRMYEITTSGQLYLAGDLDAQDVPAPGPVWVGSPPDPRSLYG